MRKGGIPQFSPFLLDIGTIKKGIDMHNYVISVNKNRTKYWKQINNNIVVKDDYIQEFKLDYFDTKLKLKKIDELELTDNNVGIGEFDITILPAIKGLNYIYCFGKSGYIISPHDVTVTEIKKNIFKKMDYKIFIKAGTYAFVDCDYVKNFLNKKQIINKDNFNINFDYDKMDNGCSDIYVVYMDDLENIKKNYEFNKKIAVYKNDGYSNGAYFIYNCDKINSYLIMNVEKEI